MVLFVAQECIVTDNHQIKYQYKYVEPLTSEQIKVICNIFEYGRKIYGIYAGYNQKFVRLSAFKQMDNNMLNELFKS
jgi:hypothetical protein